MHHQWSTVSGPCQSPGTASGLGAVSTSTWNSSGRGAPRRLAAVGAHRAYSSQPPTDRRIGHTTCNPDERPARPRGRPSREATSTDAMTAAPRAQLGAPQLVETPLFESDSRRDVPCQAGPWRVVLNTDFGSVLMRRATA